MPVAKEQKELITEMYTEERKSETKSLPGHLLVKNSFKI